MENQPKTRVLIVDDDKTLCDMYSERLKAEGFEVVVAHNGEEGVAKATQTLPSVILLDLMMPKVNGFNTLEILKSTEETKNIPVLLLTALIQEENKRRGLQAGAEDYIIKSETMPGDVITKIKAAVEKGKQAQARAAGENPPASSVGSRPPAAQSAPAPREEMQTTFPQQETPAEPLANPAPAPEPATPPPPPAPEVSQSEQSYTPPVPPLPSEQEQQLSVPPPPPPQTSVPSPTTEPTNQPPSPSNPTDNQMPH